MSDRGYIAIARGWFEHPGFALEPFTEREAWHWLIEQAAWKECRKSVGRTNVPVKRGQCAFAIRFMAQRWQWSDSRVRRFLERRAAGEQITIQATRDSTIITICNYDKFQGERRAGDAHIGEHIGEQTDTKKKKQPITNNQEDLLGAVATAPRPDAGKTFDQFWGTYPKRDGANPKAPARKAYIAAVKSGVDPMAIIHGASHYGADLSKSMKVNTPYVAQAKTWLNQRRWEDHAEAVTETTGPPKPPVPGGPSHEELLRKYGGANARGDQEKGSGVRQEGGGVHRQAPSAGSKDAADDPSDDAGMGGMGSLFSRTPRVLSMGDETRSAGLCCGEAGGGDDGPYPMARMVRQ